MTGVTRASKPRICEGGTGLVIQATDSPDRVFRIILYFIALAWLFMGVAVISDVFMSAIETITAKKAQIRDKETGKLRTVKIWNDTIANLTLMALGSSAPEIMLSIIELLGNDMHSGDLGPGTIVGSAAFNLLVISAICVGAIPSPEVRAIEDVTVYIVCASFSVLAYIWILIVLRVISEDVVQLWEALVTLGLFPTLLFVAYLADVGYLGGKPAVANRRTILLEEMTTDEIAEAISQVAAAPTAEASRSPYPSETSKDSKKASAANAAEETKPINPVTSTVRRPTRSVRHTMLSRQSISAPIPPMRKSVMDPNAVDTALLSEVARKAEAVTASRLTIRVACVEMERQTYLIKEGTRQAVAEVRRTDSLSFPLTVKYRTQAQTAHPLIHYKPVNGTLTFGVGQTRQNITVDLMPFENLTESVDFCVEIYDPSCEPATAEVGGNSSATFTLAVNTGLPGDLSFESPVIECIEGQEEVVVKAQVLRCGGSHGRVSCKYRTEEDTAMANQEFIHTEGTLVFQHGEIEGTIPVTIKKSMNYAGVRELRVFIFEANGCKLSQDCEKGDDGDMLSCTIRLKVDETHTAKIHNVVCMLRPEGQNCKNVMGVWKEQFTDAFLIGGGDDEDEEGDEDVETEKPGVLAWIEFILSFFWKLLFALVPPPMLFDGWACFVGALVFLAILTAFITDLAALVGCEMGVPDAVTAITFVALGTSLPDTFASKAAAVHLDTADASIGNIVGSNSVNVFLGLGLSWTIASVHWSINGQTPKWKSYYPGFADRYDGGVFVVEAKDLSFSVFMFTCCAVSCIFVMGVRRYLFNGELGGPFVPKVATIVYLMGLWLMYVGISWVHLNVDQ